MRVAALLLAVLVAPALAGCTLPPPGPADPPASTTPPGPLVRVDPVPPAGGFAPCATRQALQLALGFTSEEVFDDQGRGVGLHRLDARTFLWVWATYPDGTLREDDVRRA